MTLKKYSIIVTFVALFALFIACGGGTKHGGFPTSGGSSTASTSLDKERFGSTGFHGTSKVVTTATSFSLIPRAYAQTTTTSVAYTGSYTGGCYWVAQPDGDQEMFISGFGDIQNDVCGGDMAVKTPEGARFDGWPILGNGTVKNLVVLGKVLSPGVTPVNATVQLYSNGKALGISCTLQQATANGQLRCEDTAHSATVVDGQTLTATIKNGVGGTDIYNLRVFVGKE